MGRGDGHLRVDGARLVGALRRLADGPAGDPTGGDPVVCRDPVFLLSAGFRSGSTLVQRMIASAGRTLMWGEPFGDHIPIHRMSQMLEPFELADSHSRNDIDHFAGELSQSWIANLNPGLLALRRAHLAWFETLFAIPARERGYPRWGCKEVRLTAYHAHYLRWLYPDAKLVFLVRHPLAALRSYRGQRDVWYLQLPDIGMRTPHDFLGHWERLARSFLAELEDLDALLLRYEDVIADPQASKRLAEHVGGEIDPAVVANTVGSTSARGSVPIAGRLEARLRLSGLLARFGYDARGGTRGPLPVRSR